MSLNRQELRELLVFINIIFKILKKALLSEKLEKDSREFFFKRQKSNLAIAKQESVKNKNDRDFRSSRYKLVKDQGQVHVEQILPARFLFSMIQRLQS